MQKVECDRSSPPPKDERNPCIEFINTSKLYLPQILEITVTYFSFTMKFLLYYTENLC